MTPIQPDSDGRVRLPAPGSVVLLHFGDTGDTVLARYYSEPKLLNGAGYGLFMEARQAGRDISDCYPVQACLEREASWEIVRVPTALDLDQLFPFRRKQLEAEDTDE